MGPIGLIGRIGSRGLNIIYRCNINIMQCCNIDYNFRVLDLGLTGQS